jgi:hypothetical protein
MGDSLSPMEICASTSSSSLSADSIVSIFEYLSVTELALQGRVCSEWKEASNNNYLWVTHLIKHGLSGYVDHKSPKDLFANPHLTIAFDAAHWSKCISYSAQGPRLRWDILEILNLNCPFWPDKKIGETHILALVPKNVSSLTTKEMISLNLRSFCTLIKSATGKIALRYISNEILLNHGATETESQWVLVTKDVIPGSRNCSYPQQKELIAKLKAIKNLRYMVPQLFPLTAAVLLEKIRSGATYFGHEPWTNTRCQESSPDKAHQVIFGSSTEKGPAIAYDDDGDGDNTGMAAMLIL